MFLFIKREKSILFKFHNIIGMVQILLMLSNQLPSFLLLGTEMIILVRWRKASLLFQVVKSKGRGILVSMMFNSKSLEKLLFLTSHSLESPWLMLSLLQCGALCGTLVSKRKRRLVLSAEVD